MTLFKLGSLSLSEATHTTVQSTFAKEAASRAAQRGDTSNTELKIGRAFGHHEPFIRVWQQHDLAELCHSKRALVKASSSLLQSSLLPFCFIILQLTDAAWLIFGSFFCKLFSSSKKKIAQGELK